MDSSLYLYCVTRAGHSPPPSLEGLAGEPISTIEAGDLAVWVSPLATSAGQATVDDIRGHNAVVEAAITSESTPIPLRFGQRMRSADAVRDLIDREREGWLDLLDVFAGTMEFGLRILAPAREAAARVVHASPAASGRDYMEQLARRRAEERGVREEAVRVAAELRPVLADMVVRERVEPLRTAHGVASIAYLVRRVAFDEYARRVEQARQTLPDLRFLASGPWPPYSFVS